MTIYKCDRCGYQVSKLDELTEVGRRVKESQLSNAMFWSIGEYCNVCWEHIQKAMRKPE